MPRPALDQPWLVVNALQSYNYIASERETELVFQPPGLAPSIISGVMGYSGTSDKGLSEIGTTSLQRTLVAAPC